MSVKTHRKIARNTLTNTLAYAVAFAANLIILPFVVHTLGNEVYGGIWIVIGTLTASLGLLDLGTGTAFVKYIAEYTTRRDDRSLSELVNTGIVMYTAIGIAILAAAWAIGGPILSLLGVPTALLDDGVFVFRVSVAIFVLANVLSPVSMILTGIQRMDLNALIVMGGQLAGAGGTVFVLRSGWGVRGLIINNLAIVTVTAMVQCAVALHMVQGIRFARSYCRMTMAKRFLRFGMNLQVSKLAQVILFQTDRIVSLRMFGMVTATYYDVGARLSSAARSSAMLSISALIPAAAELHAQDDRARLLLLYKRGTKYTAIVATVTFGFITWFASDVMRAWMGTEYLASVPIAIALASGYFLNISTGVASALAAGMGRTDYERTYGLFTALVNLPVTIGMAFFFGPIGIAIGTSMTLLFGGVYFLFQIHRFLGKPKGVLRDSLLRPLVASLFSGAIVFALREMFFGIPSARSGMILLLVLLLLVFLIADGVLLLLLRVVGKEDLATLRGLLRGEPQGEPA